MDMEFNKNTLTGGSDTRQRQEESTVPALLRSRFGESNDGLCAAGIVDERATAGVTLSCSAGEGSTNAPAMGDLKESTPLARKS